MGKLKQIITGKLDYTYIIAEIGINHNGSLDTALELIYKAKEADVDAVKFQKRNLEAIYGKDILQDPNSQEWSFEYLIPILKEIELSKKDYSIIKGVCKKLKLDLIITPMDEDSVEFVSKLGISGVKIASADMTNFSLIKKCSKLNLPFIISTGMWAEKDIKECTEYYKKLGINYSLLLANSTYPSPYEDLNLNFISKLKSMSDIVGYSGHERGLFIPIAAVTLGAKIIEKHITLDRNQRGPDHKASMLPNEWNLMVENIRNLEKSLGNIKSVNQAELLNKEVFAKSAYSTTEFKTGHILLENDVYFKSPGKGIFEHQLSNFIGRTLKDDISSDECISKEDFETITKINNWRKFDFEKKWGVKCRFHDYEKYKILKAPVMEFHCSESDLLLDFNDKNLDSELIIHAPEIVEREIVDICSKNQRVVEQSLDILQRTIDRTIEISSNWPLAKPKMVVHLGGMSMDKLKESKYKVNTLSTHEEMISIAIENFKKLNYSVDDIDILPENLPPRPWYLGGEWFQYGYGPSADMIRFCKEFDLKMTFDISHAQLWCNLEGITLREYAEQVMPYVAHVHISDAVGLNGEGLQIAEGDVDFKSIMSLFKSYDFSWVTEIWSGHLHHGCGTYKAMCDLNDNFGSSL
jgi:N-acetylneuraminate synthase